LPRLESGSDRALLHGSLQTEEKPGQEFERLDVQD